MRKLIDTKESSPPFDGAAYSKPFIPPSQMAPLSKGLAVPFNWDRALLEFFGLLNEAENTKHRVRLVYASDQFGLVGHGRGEDVPQRELPVSEYVKVAHDQGIQFAFLWNSPAQHEGESTEEFWEDLRRETDELVDAGVDAIVAAKPNVLHFLRSWYPDLHLSSSVNSKIDSVERARQLVDYFNIGTIITDHRNPRNFQLVRELRASFPDREIEVLVNESCLRDCVLQGFHQTELGAASCRGKPSRTAGLCNALCGRIKLDDLVNTLRAPWIRPEDIHHVFEQGASLVKLAGRTESTAWIRELVTAYGTANLDGDIFRFIEKSGNRDRAWAAFRGKEMQPCRPKVDNKALDGFIKPFLTGTVPCVQGTNGCAGCRWCESWMHAVTPPENVKERIADIEAVLAGCANGVLVRKVEEPAAFKAEELVSA